MWHVLGVNTLGVNTKRIRNINSAQGFTMRRQWQNPPQIYHAALGVFKGAAGSQSCQMVNIMVDPKPNMAMSWVSTPQKDSKHKWQNTVGTQNQIYHAMWHVLGVNTAKGFET